MSRASRFLPALAAASAVVATLGFVAAYWASLDYLFKETTRVTMNFGSFQGMPVATLDEIRDAEKLARALRYVWRAAAGVFVLTTAVAIFATRERVRDWPWFSAVSLAVGLGVLGFGLLMPLVFWGLPFVLGMLAAALAGFELYRARRAERKVSIVTWTAIGVAVCALVVNVVHVH